VERRPNNFQRKYVHQVPRENVSSRDFYRGKKVEPVLYSPKEDLSVLGINHYGISPLILGDNSYSSKKKDLVSEITGKLEKVVLCCVELFL